MPHGVRGAHLGAPGHSPGLQSIFAVRLDLRLTIWYNSPMKCTQYFVHVRKRADRQEIRDAWIERVISNPCAEVVQVDGRIRRWGKIDETGGRYLRVVLLEDGETVHNAFFDRRFRESEHEG